MSDLSWKLLNIFRFAISIVIAIVIAFALRCWFYRQLSSRRLPNINCLSAGTPNESSVSSFAIAIAFAFAIIIAIAIAFAIANTSRDTGLSHLFLFCHFHCLAITIAIAIAIANTASNTIANIIAIPLVVLAASLQLLFINW